MTFGQNDASEYFLKKLVVAIQGLHGVVYSAVDVVIRGRDTEQHDGHLNLFLSQCRERDITLTKEKIETKIEYVTFVCHRVPNNGLSSDTNKVSSMREMKETCSSQILRRFLWKLIYLAKFLPNSTTLMNPPPQLAEEGRYVELVYFPAETI